MQCLFHACSHHVHIACTLSRLTRVVASCYDFWKQLWTRQEKRKKRKKEKKRKKKHNKRKMKRGFNNRQSLILNLSRFIKEFGRIPRALSVRVSGFEENTRVPRLNECRVSSESKQRVFPSSLSRSFFEKWTRDGDREWTRKDKRPLQWE